MEMEMREAAVGGSRSRNHSTRHAADDRPALATLGRDAPGGDGPGPAGSGRDETRRDGPAGQSRRAPIAVLAK